MAESESEVGEADVEIEDHVCNFLTIDISCISLCLGIKRAIRIRIARFLPKSSQAEKVLFEFEQRAFCLSFFRQKVRCSNSNSTLSV
jgi:hypothetical protein